MKKIKKEKKEHISLGVKTQVALNTAVQNAIQIKAKPIIVDTLYISWLIWTTKVPNDVSNNNLSINEFINIYLDYLHNHNNNTDLDLYNEFKNIVESEI